MAAADRQAARFIGRDGYRPCPVGLWGLPRTQAPNAGLLAADREDLKLHEFLAQRRPGFSYEDYGAELKLAGFRVAGEESGYLIRDEANQAFYPGYYLQGVYSEQDGNLWKGRQGEAIRCELNQRMGEDLVQYGPHDLWELRKQSGLLREPALPVLIFEPDGNVDVRQTSDELRGYYLYRRLPWKWLYGEGSE